MQWLRNLFGSHVPAPPVQRALAWLEAQSAPGGGVRVHSRHRRGYPEVTGYLIPTLVARDQWSLADQWLRWLVSIQRPDGAFPDPDRGTPYVFDTGQALRGLLAGMDRVPEAAEAARRAAQYLVEQMVDQGRGGFPPQFQWYEAPTIQETILLYVLPPLRDAADGLNRPEWRTAADHCLAYYLTHDQLLQADRLTHFLAYELEALIDLSCAERAQGVLDQLAEAQRPDGAVRGAGGVQWVCVPGLAQLAVCWYKRGQTEPADRAMAWLRQHQRRSGAFLGSIGRGATYFPRREIPWAVKYFLDADLLGSARRG